MPRARCRRSWRTSGAAPWGAAPRPGTAAPVVAVGLLAAAAAVALPASDQRLHYSSSLPTFRNQVNVKVHTTPLSHITNSNALVPLVPILPQATLIHGHGKASFFEANKGVGRCVGRASAFYHMWLRWIFHIVTLALRLDPISRRG